MAGYFDWVPDAHTAKTLQKFAEYQSGGAAKQWLLDLGASEATASFSAKNVLPADAFGSLPWPPEKIPPGTRMTITCLSGPYSGLVISYGGKERKASPNIDPTVTIQMGLELDT